MNEIHIKEIISAVNNGRFRKSSIPTQLASGWPSIHYIGKTLCVTIPYFSRAIKNDKVLLYPLYCSVTVPLGNIERIMDFTVYRYHPDWMGVNYDQPCGYFRHDALKNVTRSQYQQMRTQLFEYYDILIAQMVSGMEIKVNTDMINLFTQLMEPCHFEQYLRINKQFYSNFCKL